MPHTSQSAMCMSHCRKVACRLKPDAQLRQSRLQCETQAIMHAMSCRHLLQAEAQRRAAAVKIAGWYKRCIETRPARLALKARRQLLPLTSLDRKKEEEQKAAAATAILVLLKDIQRGHRFARAVKEFLCKVRCLSTNCRAQGVSSLCR